VLRFSVLTGAWRVALCGVLASVFRDCLVLVLISFMAAATLIKFWHLAIDVWFCLKEEWSCLSLYACIFVFCFWFLDVVVLS
jgi:hypothetical protein